MGNSRQNQEGRPGGTTRKLVRRIDVRKLNPKDCCFIFPFFPSESPPVFRIYNRAEGTFRDYTVRNGVTPFVQLVSDDFELKEYVEVRDGEEWYTTFEMDFPEFALTAGKARLLEPGEVWVAE